VFLFARRLFEDPRTAVFAAWIFALGGLHVSQSHFFVADVASLFWSMLGLYLLYREMETTERADFAYLVGAAFSLGIAFGVKFVIIGLLPLACIALVRRPRLMRAIYVGIFFLAGVVVVNFASYTPIDLYETAVRGVSDPFRWSSLSTAFLYLVELPSVVSFPILFLVLIGFFLMLKNVRSKTANSKFLPIILIVISPLFIHLLLLLFKLDNFPRHLLPFVPWISILAAWCLTLVTEKVARKNIHPVFVIFPIFLYLAAFVYDGEKVFIQEPRNKAAVWVLRNVAPGTPIYWRTPDRLKGYPYVHFPIEGRPPVLVLQMDRANHYLSGMGLRNSYPRDYRFIFDSESQERIEGLQAVFKGKSEYEEAVRFKEGYFMPEYRLVDHLVGNRSRNYVSEIVVFERKQNTEDSRYPDPRV
jgi:hypothetical protein